MGNGSSTSFKDGLLTKKELERVKRRFQRLAEGAKGLSLADFRQPPLGIDNPLMALIFQLCDADRDGLLNEAEFEAALGRLAKLRTEDDRSHFAFCVYNTSGSGYLSLAELAALLHTLAGQALSEEQVGDIARATLEEFDLDGDGRLSQDEFYALVNPEGSGTWGQTRRRGD